MRIVYDLIYIAPTFIVSSCDIYTHTFNFHKLACGQYKNVRGICLSHTNTFSLPIHPTFIECVMGFSCCFAIRFSLFRFMIFALRPFCVTISLCLFLQYIHIHICITIYTVIYILYIDSYIVLRKSFAFKRQKVLRFRTITSNKTAGCKRRSTILFSLPHLLPFRLNIPSTVATTCSEWLCVCVGGLMSLPRHTDSIWARSIYITELSFIFHLLRSYCSLSLPCFELVLVSIFVEV